MLMYLCTVCIEVCAAVQGEFAGVMCACSIHATCV